MKFYYSIRKESENNFMVTIPCPYITEEYAITYMQQFIKDNPNTMKLHDGTYAVNLYNDTFQQPIDRCTSVSFTKKAHKIAFL